MKSIYDKIISIPVYKCTKGNALQFKTSISIFCNYPGKSVCVYVEDNLRENHALIWLLKIKVTVPY